jgi:hypothetical protein
MIVLDEPCRGPTARHLYPLLSPSSVSAVFFVIFGGNHSCVLHRTGDFFAGQSKANTDIVLPENNIGTVLKNRAKRVESI